MIIIVMVMKIIKKLLITSTQIQMIFGFIEH